jgi:hypothetical protein
VVDLCSRLQAHLSFGEKVPHNWGHLHAVIPGRAAG